MFSWNFNSEACSCFALFDGVRGTFRCILSLDLVCIIFYYLLDHEF